MSKLIVASFEENAVKVIYAERKKKSLSVERSLTVPESEFDDFLKREKTKEFIVVCNFSDYFFDTIQVPPARGKVMKTLLAGEIRKRARMEDFRFVYYDLGEKIVERKKVREIFVFAVDREYVNGIVTRFTSRGKVVRALYPDLFALAGFIDAGEEPVMGVMETGSNKRLFLVREGRIHFLRAVQSFERGIRAQDVQTITMTVDYCDSTFKMIPRTVFLLGRLCGDYEAQPGPGYALMSFYDPAMNLTAGEGCPGYEYAVPLAALFLRDGQAADLLPKEDRVVFLTDKALRIATAIFCVVTAVGLLQLGFIAYDMYNLYGEINSARTRMARVNTTLEKYRIKREAFTAYRPFVDSYRAYVETPDTHGFMSHLPRLSLDNIQIQTIAIGRGDMQESVGNVPGESKERAVLTGLVEVDGFASMQKYYQGFLESIKAMDKVEIREQSLDLRTRNFIIEVAYR